MIRLAIAVEGQTEEEFIKRVLADYLRTKSVEPTPVPLGGNISGGRLTHYMARLYLSFSAVTSLVDFYGFKDKGNRTVNELEEYLHEQIGSRIAAVGTKRECSPTSSSMSSRACYSRT